MADRERVYLTVDLARASDTHPNTVRLYEQWGFLAPAARGDNGYRLWTADHLDQMVFARRALHGEWPGRRIRESALSLVRLAATGDLSAAAEYARSHALLVREERGRAEAAAAFLESWANGKADPRSSIAPPLSPRDAAAAVDATEGQVRNWERNHLINTPRDKRTGQRMYGFIEIGRLRVIRTLLLAGYSVMAVLRMTTELDKGRRSDLRDVLDTLADGEEAFTAFDCWLTSLDAQEKRAAEIIGLIRTRIARRNLHREAPPRPFS
ncbi:MAG: MerR family transcriptional regulator [Treponemataceae bacterium]